MNVGLPKTKDRIALLKRHLEEINHNITDDVIERLADSLSGWSGSDLESLIRETAMGPVREIIQEAGKVGRKYAKQTARESGDTSEDIGRVRTQIYLEEEITKLRPVTYKDFIKAIQFWSDRVALGSTKEVTSPLVKLGHRQPSPGDTGDTSDEDE